MENKGKLILTFVVNTTFSTGLVGVEVTSVSWLCPSQETEETSAPTRPVENVVITTKSLQERLMGRR